MHTSSGRSWEKFSASNMQRIRFEAEKRWAWCVLVLSPFLPCCFPTATLCKIPLVLRNVSGNHIVAMKSHAKGKLNGNVAGGENALISTTKRSPQTHCGFQADAVTAREKVFCARWRLVRTGKPWETLALMVPSVRDCLKLKSDACSGNKNKSFIQCKLLDRSLILLSAGHRSMVFCCCYSWPLAS